MSKRWPDKTVIGLTGNIATGKSIVRRMLEHLGAFDIDADGLAHRAMSPGAPAYQPIVANFGKWLLAPDGQIDREKLGNVVFSDPEALKQLETITHPIVSQVIDLLIKRATQKVVAIEAIKLFESGLADGCDTTWVVDAPEELQVKRLTTDRKLSEPAAKLRISSQPPQKEKVARAKVKIANTGGFDTLWDAVQKEWDKLVGVQPAAPAATPTAQPAAAAAAPAAIGDAAVKTQRGGPKQAEEIANFMNKVQGSSLSRVDILQRFGQKAYMLAFAGEQMVALAGWQVENLIARIDEFMIAAGVPEDKTAKSLIETIESAANGLQAEISLLFLKNNTPDAVRRAVLIAGYEPQTPADFRVPDWREAAEESQPPDTYLVAKRLRADRVLKPV